jgi:hypothetical protein
MDKEVLAPLSRLLSDVILPNLQSVKSSQMEQIAANDRLEQAIEDLRVHLEAQFAHLSAQLTACRAELAATQAMARMMNEQGCSCGSDRASLVH